MGLLKAEAYRLSRLGLLRVAAAMLLLAALLRGTVWPSAAGVPQHGLWSFIPVAAAVTIITAVTLGQEFSEGTFRALVTRGVARWHFLVARFMLLATLAGVLLLITEGLATFLGVRQALHPGELLRAWLSLWPYVALVMVMVVAARNGGLALVVGVLLLALEQFTAMLVVPLTMTAEVMPEKTLLGTYVELSKTLYGWSLAYNGANWTYLADSTQAPVPMSFVILNQPGPPARSGLLLAAYTLIGLGLAATLLYRRDVTEVIPGKARLWGLVSRPGRVARTAHPGRLIRLPAGTGRGPLTVRLVRGHLFRLGRTALLRISALVALLFPLTLWGAGALAKEAGYGDLLWSYGAGNAPPLAFVFSLLVVGPLAAVVGALSVSNELVLGTRRAELARGAGPHHVIVAQSLALVLALGAVLALMAGVSLLIGAHFAGTWYLVPAITEVVAGTLGAGVYVAAVQVGGALTRSPAGALLFGLGFLVADWMLLLAPTLSSESGVLADLARGAASICTLAVASWGGLEATQYGWELPDLAPALILLIIYVVVGHAVAVLVAERRDA